MTAPRIALLSWVAAAILGAGCGGSDSAASSGNMGGELIVTVSPEGLGAHGYAFPPSAGQELAFVDGWELRFDRILVVIDNIRLAELPDKNPGNQAETGPELTLRKGPWAVDLKQSANAMDKGGAGKVAIRLPISDLRGIFDLEQRYAFSYDLVPASAGAQMVNMDVADPDYQQMIADGLRVLATGEASFKAVASNCQDSGGDYDWSAIPTKVKFRFALRNAVSYRNCQNSDNTGEPLAGEEAQRGIQLLANAPVTAQITIHTDHFFWSSISHGNVPMFNQFAANATAQGSEWMVDLDALGSVPISPVTDAGQKPLPWRSCVDASEYKLPTMPPQMTFETEGQPLNSLREYVDFNATTMGHLNADGLCSVSR